jgi:hypothetical protein
MRYFPLGLQLIPRTGPLCPDMAPISVQTSSPLFWGDVSQLQRLQPPPHPHANACFPCCAHTPPTNPPRRCPPMSPKRWRLIQMEDDLSCTVAGDHNIKEESVDVDNRVGEDSVVLGPHPTEVTPASCPMSNASKVTQYCWELVEFQPHKKKT